MSAVSNFKLVFMGTPEFAVPALQGLVRAGYPILSVVTQPDKPRGRKRALTPCPVKEYSMKEGLPVIQPQYLKESSFVERLRLLNPDVIVVTAYGKILPKEVLDIPRYGCINIHASLLPRYRGAAPVHWAVLQGESKTGVTTMLMDEGLDTGDILLQRKLAVDSEETMGMVYSKLASLGAKLIVETLEKLGTEEIYPVPQDDTQASYAPPIEKKHEIVYWNRPAVEIKNQIRGLNPWPGAYTTLNGKILKIWQATVLESDSSRGMSGAILQASDAEGLVIQTADKPLRLITVQLAGKKPMSVADFLRGFSLSAGDYLGS